MIVTATPRDRARRMGILALVFALHAIIGWTLLLATRMGSIPTGSRGLEIFFITPAAVESHAANSPTTRFEEGHTRQSPGGDSAALRRRNNAPPPRPAPGPAPGPGPMLSDTKGSADQPPIDWAEELSRAAQAARDLSTGPPPKDFGFPIARDSSPAKTQEFGWSHAQTHRTESLPGGGILVNLNDNCVLILAFPIPFAACRIGTRPANGDLFKHMHDSPAAESHDNK